MNKPRLYNFFFVVLFIRSQLIDGFAQDISVRIFKDRPLNSSYYTWYNSINDFLYGNSSHSTYDLNGNEITTIREDTVQHINLDRTFSSYDTYNRETKSITQLWENTGYVNFREIDSPSDSYGNNSGYCVKMWNKNSNSWDTTWYADRYSFQYNQNHFVIQRIWEQRDTSGIWSNVEKDSLFLNSDGNILCKTIFRWNGTWYLSSRFTDYVYLNDQIRSFTSQLWNGIAFVNSSKRNTDYLANGGFVRTDYSYFNGTWESTDKEIYTNDENENLVDHAYTYWESSQNRWITWSEVFYQHKYNALDQRFETLEYIRNDNDLSLRLSGKIQNCCFFHSSNAESDFQFILLPNPSHSFTKIKLEDVGFVGTLRIFNSLGESVYVENFIDLTNQCEKEIDISQFQYGIYYIELLDDKKKGIQKFVKN